MSHGSLYNDLDDTRLVSRAHQARCSNGLLAGPRSAPPERLWLPSRVEVPIRIVCQAAEVRAV